MSKVRRNEKGFSLALSIFVGIILTGMTFAIMKRSSTEVQVASSNSDAVNALNAAESAGSLAMDDLIKRGNSVTIPAGTTADTVLGYLCKDNPMWALVESPTAGATYRLIATNSSTTAAPTFLKKDGSAAAANGSDALDPISLLSDETLPLPSTTNRGVIKAKNSNGITYSVDANTNFSSNLGMSSLTINSCSTLTNSRTTTGGNITARSYLPGGLSWSNVAGQPNQVDTSTGDIIISEKRTGSLGDKQIWGRATLENFTLSKVLVIARAGAGDPKRNKPLSLFRLVYSFNVRSEGQIRSSSGNIIGRQIIQAPNVLIVDMVQQNNSNFAQYAFFLDDMNNIPFGSFGLWDGNVHINTAPLFGVKSGETPPIFKGNFTTAGCRTKNSQANACQTINQPLGRFGTWSNPYNTSATLQQSATFEGGAKFSEDGIGRIDKPSDGGYQLMAALNGQQEASANPNDDVLKNSEVRNKIGVKVSSTTASAEDSAPNGVYWTNPTDKNAASTNSTKPATYSEWLNKATDASNANNTTSNLLSGLYVKGDLDYINTYAAKSSNSSPSADTQVIEIQQTTIEASKSVTRRTKFTMNKSANTLSVRVDSGSGYGAAINYNNAPNGVIFVDGKVGTDVGTNPAYTQGCTAAAKNSCRGVISIPENPAQANTLSFPGGNTDTPSIQKDWGITIAANGSVAIQDNLDYEVDPRGADKTFDNPTTTSGTHDDPPVSQAQNTLGIVALEKKKVKDASGVVVESQVNGNIYWGKGLQDNVRRGRDPANTKDVDVVDIQAALYGTQVGRGSALNTRLAEYIRLLGGEVATTSLGNFTRNTDGSNCTNTTLPNGGGTLSSQVCLGARMNLTGDRRMQNGELSPPGYPTIAGGGAIRFVTSPVGQQSIGKTRWQTLMYDPN